MADAHGNMADAHGNMADAHGSMADAHGNMADAHRSMAHQTAAEDDAVLPKTNWKDPMRSVPRWYRSDGTLGWTGPRIAAASCIKRHMASTAATHDFQDIYEFGVYTGGGLREWLRRGLNTSRTHVWGFDSFQGMPDNDALVDRKQHVTPQMP